MGRARLKGRESDQIDLTRLPNDKIADKARTILNAIESGVCYTNFKGKRLKYNRNIISVPVNRDYRLIYDVSSVGMTPRKVMSHEEYNATKPAALA